MSRSELASIRSVGHWEVVIRPTLFEADRIRRVAECWAAVETSQVRLRGWDFPHIYSEYREGYGDYIESGGEFGREGEFWRLYRSAQFVYFSTYFEDHHEVPWWSSAYPEKGKPDRYFLIVSNLYRITELYEFAARLARSQLLGSEVFISITLHDTLGKHLVYWEGGRFLIGPYVCNTSEVVVAHTHSAEELISRTAALALETTVDVFDRFNWSDPPKELLAADQRKLLERLL